MWGRGGGGSNIIEKIAEKVFVPVAAGASGALIMILLDENVIMEIQLSSFNDEQNTYLSEDFSNLQLSGREINSLSLKKCSFMGCDFSDADFISTDFSNSLFRGTDLSRADFTESINYKIDININKINGAKFSRYEALSLLECLDIDLID